MVQIYDQYIQFVEMCDNRRYREAEALLKDIIVDVLEINGTKLNIYPTTAIRDGNFDYLGEIINRGMEESIAIELKVSQHNISLNKISSVIISAIERNIKNIVLVSNSNFTASATKTALNVADKEDINLQILGRRELDEWFSTYKQPEDFINANSVHLIISEFSRMLAKRIAAYPEELMNIEWRDLERIIATIFSDFGYDVNLTPSAKDGGKDVIVWYRGESYIIEIKHWSKKSRVGESYIRDFLQVVIRENRKLGLYLSSSGYTTNAFETLTYIDKVYLRHGDKNSMQLLFKMYEKVNNGLYIPANDPEELIDSISQKVE